MVAMDLSVLPQQGVVPGLNALLGLPRRTATVAPDETWEDLCARISRGQAARYRVHVAADGQVLEVTA